MHPYTSEMPPFILKSLTLPKRTDSSGSQLPTRSCLALLETLSSLLLSKVRHCGSGAQFSFERALDSFG